MSVNIINNACIWLHNHTFKPNQLYGWILSRRKHFTLYYIGPNSTPYHRYWLGYKDIWFWYKEKRHYLEYIKKADMNVTGRMNIKENTRLAFGYFSNVFMFFKSYKEVRDGIFLEIWYLYFWIDSCWFQQMLSVVFSTYDRIFD